MAPEEDPGGWDAAKLAAMKCGYEVLVVDLDGTLLGPRGSVSEANREAVGRAREAGIEIVIATGRAMGESLEFLEAIEHEGLVIAAGGAILNDAATGRTLDRTVMEHGLVVEVSEALVEGGHKVLLLKDSNVTGYDYLAIGAAELDAASQWWFEKLPMRVEYVDGVADDPDPHETVRAGAVAKESELAPIAAELKGRIGDRGYLQHWGAVTETANTGDQTHVLEVFSPKVNKWTMICRYCEERGIDTSRVAAIGDGLNDVQIVREAGLGIAMGNADERVRSVADRVTADWESDGVAVAIESILSSQW